MPDIQLNRYRAGDGAPPIVFVHGLLCRYQDWQGQLDHFARSHRVIACDLRGHGETPRGEAAMTLETLGGDVAALLAAEELTGAVLVGHSMGCRVVMEARRQASARVAGLVLVDGSRFGTDRDAGLKSLEAGIAEHGFPALVSGLFEDMFIGDPPAWKAEKMEQVLAIPEEVGLSLLRSMLAWDADRLERELDAIDVPVLAIQSTVIGEDRRRKPLQAGELSPYQTLVQERVPGSECTTLPGLGHFCMMEAPDAVNARIGQFIASRIPASA